MSSQQGSSYWSLDYNGNKIHLKCHVEEWLQEDETPEACEMKIVLILLGQKMKWKEHFKKLMAPKLSTLFKKMNQIG